MADLLYNALRRNLTAAEEAGDKDRVAILRQRLAAREAELAAAPATVSAEAEPAAKPRRRSPAKTSKPRSAAAVAAPKKRAAPKRSEPKPAVEVVFTPAAKKED